MDEMIFVICVQNEDYPASLELQRIYQTLPDVESEKHGMMRIIDESGEGYLYPADYFITVKLSKPFEEALEKLEHRELAAAYKEHAKDWQRNPDRAFWDEAAVDDGLDSEESSW